MVRLRFEQDFTARLFVKISLRRLLFRKNVNADFYGLLDIDSVVTDFDPNTGQTSNQNDGEGLEQVSAPMGFVEALVKEINSEIPGADEVVIS